MDAFGWIITVLIWLVGVSSLFCLTVVIIALAYPAIVMIEELVLRRKSTFLLFDIERPERMHFFVDMPNEVVIPVVGLGHNLREFMSNSDHKDFYGNGTNKERWKIVEKEQATPQQYISNIEVWYRHYIHKLTGRVYIGFYPFHKVPTKEITKKVKLNDAPRNDQWFENVQSRSNHLRIRPFEWNIQISEAEVAGLIPVNVYGVILFECVNPYESWYGIDAWDSQLTNAPVSTTRNILKNWAVGDVLAGNEKDQGDVVAKAGKRLEIELIEALKGEYGDEIFGFKVVRVQIFDVKPLLTETQLEKARAAFFAQREGEAYKITQKARGDGDSGYLETMSNQLKSDSEHGRFITEQDTRRKMAEGGKSTVIFDNAAGATPPLEKTLMLLVDRLDKLVQPDKQSSKK